AHDDRQHHRLGEDPTAEDRPDRPAQAHRSRPDRSAANVIGSKGLANTPSAPRPRRRSRSAAWVLAVRNTIGTAAVAGSARRAWKVSGPSMPGIITSSTMASGGSATASDTASAPDAAVTTSMPPTRPKASE